MENYLDNIDLYEVDKQDYRSYEYRCKDRQTMKVRPREGVSVFKDIKQANGYMVMKKRM